MQPALRENECLDRFVGALRRVVRPVGAQLQARQAEGLAFQMFVAGLATDGIASASARNSAAGVC